MKAEIVPKWLSVVAKVEKDGICELMMGRVYFDHSNSNE